MSRMWLLWAIAAACADADQDGWPIPDDCDDRDAAVHPGAPERCAPAGVDEDCDGLADGDDPDSVNTLFVDGDEDGEGDPRAALLARSCVATPGTADNARDCDDTRADVHVGARELCDGTDNDCDGLVDDADDDVDPDGAAWWYADADFDGWGDAESAVLACVAPEAHAAEPGDCDDARPGVHPGASEVCGNRLDDNCDGDSAPCGIAGEEEALDGFPWVDGIASGPFAGWATASAGDVDGDGWGDVVVGAPRADYPWVTVLRGPLPEPELVLEDRPRWVDGDRSRFGSAVLAPGDLDGDGAADLVVGAPRTDVPVARGGAVWLLGIPERIAVVRPDSGTVVTGDPGEELGVALAAGDVDGDRVLDLVVGGTFSPAERGTATLLRGPFPDGDTPDRPRWRGAAGSGLGQVVAAADLDGDGGDEALIAAMGEGAVYVVFWPAPDSLADAVRVSPGAETGFGAALDARRDLDEDGLADVLVGRPGDGAAEVWSGAALLGSGGPWARFEAGDLPIEQFGRSVTTLGDANGDGWAEVVVAGASNQEPGSVVAFAGPVGGTRTPADTDGIYWNWTTGASFGARVFDLGDIDANGRADLGVYAGEAPDTSPDTLSALWFRLAEGP